MAFNPAHSVSMMENTTVSRSVPSAWRVWLRSTPSCFAPSRAIAVREVWLNQLVSNATLKHPNVSKAYCSSISLASVLTPLRCMRGAYQV